MEKDLKDFLCTNLENLHLHFKAALSDTSTAETSMLLIHQDCIAMLSYSGATSSGLTYAILSSLQTLAAKIKEIEGISVGLVKAHIDALTALLYLKDNEDVGDIGMELLRELQTLSEDYVS